MSQQSQLANQLGAEDKPFDDAAKGLIEDSATDSGFISSGNLMISGEIESESDLGSDKQPMLPSSSTEIVEPVDLDSGVITSMKFDSGVHLSESFSNLSVQNKESAKHLNDLNSKCSSLVKSGKNISKDSQASASPTVTTNVDQQDLWKIYYEQDEDGDTQLHMAIAQQFIEVAFALICASPHPRLLDTANDDGQTPLHLAVASGQSQVTRWLVLAGARLSMRNIRGDSPLHVASAAGDVATCKALTDPVKRHEREQLQLKYDASVGGLEIMDLNQWNYDGQTCVHLAAQLGHIDVLRHLVACGADINAREGCAGNTALHYAAMRNDVQLARYLLDSDCARRMDVEQVNYSGRSALELEGELNAALRQMMQEAGVPWGADWDDSEEDSDDEDGSMMEDDSHQMAFQRSAPMVNASA